MMNNQQNVYCEGWWEQDGYGQQPMRDLRLSFEFDMVKGTGTDMIGDFELEGSIAGTTITLNKQYKGAHSVTYLGIWDGEGTYQGSWNVSGAVGRWLIKVVSAESGSGIQELSPASSGD